MTTVPGEMPGGGDPASDVLFGSELAAPARGISTSAEPALLRTVSLTAGYGDFQALFGIDFELGPGEVAAVVGANGAGKSTFLKAVCGLLPVARAQVLLDGEAVGGLPAHQIARRGVAMVPEGRRLFSSLTVEENLLVGGHRGRLDPARLARVYALFPELAARRGAFPGTLSGGEQQMAAIGRALMAEPRLLIVDELSLGLAPVVVTRLYAALRGIVAAGLAAIIVEQDVTLAKAMSSTLYCLQEGRVALRGPSAGLTREEISRAYFGR